MQMYEKIKKQNGEKFAQGLRNFHNGLFEIPDIDAMLRYAGRDAEPLRPYLLALLAPNDNAPPASETTDPFSLLDQAGYDAFHADTLKKQNSIKHHFAPGELLCTFNDSARHKNYHIVHAVKKDVADIRRADFRGKEARQDDYGTSVISIQMLKQGGFISIKNRYNHTVDACDNTFGSNPDKIIPGLAAALKSHFNVDFTATGEELPDGFVLMNGRIFKYHTEQNNLYFGDGAWAAGGTINAVDRAAGDALFDYFLFDNETKTLKKIDTSLSDSFADDFNRCYGGNKGLHIQNGNLMLNGEMLIGAEHSRIKRLSLPALTVMGNYCLAGASFLDELHLPALKTMQKYSFFNAKALREFNAPALTTMNDSCLQIANALLSFHAPVLKEMGDECLRDTYHLKAFVAPKLITMGHHCLGNAVSLMECHAPALTIMADYCLQNVSALRIFHAPVLERMGTCCLQSSVSLKQFYAPALLSMANKSLQKIPSLEEFNAPSLTVMAADCLEKASILKEFNAPALRLMGNYCFLDAWALKKFHAPALEIMGDYCFHNAGSLMQFVAPLLKKMGTGCLKNAPALKEFHAPLATSRGYYLQRFKQACATWGDNFLRSLTPG